MFLSNLKGISLEQCWNSCCKTVKNLCCSVLLGLFDIFFFFLTFWKMILTPESEPDLEIKGKHSSLHIKKVIMFAEQEQQQTTREILIRLEHLFSSIKSV